MSKKKVTHLSDTESIARSILLGVEATTSCGEKRKYTREEFDGPLDGKVCQACMSAFDTTADGATIIQRRGWIDIAERVLRGRLEDEAKTARRGTYANTAWTVTAINVPSWNGTEWTKRGDS